MVSSDKLRQPGGVALDREGFTQNRCGTQQAARIEIPVRISPFIHQPLAHSIKVTSDIFPLGRKDLFPRVSGYLENESMSSGIRVNRGEVAAQFCRADDLSKNERSRRLLTVGEPPEGGFRTAACRFQIKM